MPFNEIYWLDKWEGKAQGGFFYRNNLFEAIEKFEQKFKKKIVGIRISDEWSIEFICEEEKEEEKNKGRRRNEKSN